MNFKQVLIRMHKRSSWRSAAASSAAAEELRGIPVRFCIETAMVNWLVVT